MGNLLTGFMFLLTGLFLFKGDSTGKNTDLNDKQDKYSPRLLEKISGSFVFIFSLLLMMGYFIPLYKNAMLLVGYFLLWVMIVLVIGMIFSNEKHQT